MSKAFIEILNVTDPHRCNCVFYARKHVPSLPFGLWTIGDKKKICNDHTPQVGSVAIIYAGMPWGHVAVVTEVGKSHITIEEANFKSCKITKRHDTSANLMILGYFNPSYPQGA